MISRKGVVKSALLRSTTEDDNVECDFIAKDDYGAIEARYSRVSIKRVDDIACTAPFRHPDDYWGNYSENVPHEATPADAG